MSIGKAPLIRLILTAAHIKLAFKAPTGHVEFMVQGLCGRGYVGFIGFRGSTRTNNGE